MPMPVSLTTSATAYGAGGRVAAFEAHGKFSKVLNTLYGTEERRTFAHGDYRIMHGLPGLWDGGFLHQILYYDVSFDPDAKKPVPRRRSPG